MKILKAKPLHHYSVHDLNLGWLDRLLLRYEQDEPTLNRRMFEEDFARLFPLTNRISNQIFSVISNDEKLSQALLSSVRTRIETRAIEQTVRWWVEEIAQLLIRFGRAYYFLTGSLGQKDFGIVPISSNTVVRFLGTHLQWVPKRAERHWGREDQELPREIRILDSAKVLRFEMPSKIKHIISLQNRILSSLDKHQFDPSNFHPQATYDNPNPVNNFQFSRWKSTQDRALYRATRSTGWNGRKFDSAKRSDFFDCHRLIRFRRNQLVLRDNILSQLGEELSRTGKAYKNDYSISISPTGELPSIVQLDGLKVKLASEALSFNEIIDYCYNR